MVVGSSSSPDEEGRGRVGRTDDTNSPAIPVRSEVPDSVEEAEIEEEDDERQSKYRERFRAGSETLNGGYNSYSQSGAESEDYERQHTSYDKQRFKRRVDEQEEGWGGFESAKRHAKDEVGDVRERTRRLDQDNVNYKKQMDQINEDNIGNVFGGMSGQDIHQIGDAMMEYERDNVDYDKQSYEARHGGWKNKIRDTVTGTVHGKFEGLKKRLEPRPKLTRAERMKLMKEKIEEGQVRVQLGTVQAKLSKQRSERVSNILDMAGLTENRTVKGKGGKPVMSSYERDFFGYSPGFVPGRGMVPKGVNTDHMAEFLGIKVPKHPQHYVHHHQGNRPKRKKGGRRRRYETEEERPRPERRALTPEEYFGI